MTRPIILDKIDNAGGKISTLYSTFTASTDNTTSISINQPQYTPATDVLEAYYENVQLFETDNYTKNANGATIDLVGFSLSAGEKITFKVYKQVSNPIITNYDGATLIDGSVTDAKLSNATGQIKDVVNKHLANYTLQVPYAAATGSANTYAVTLTPAPTSYVEGMAISVKINTDSTNTSTINVNGLGAKTIKKANGTDVTNLKANGIYTLRYNGVNFILQGEGASGNATASDLLSGKTASTDAGDIVGTLTVESLGGVAVNGQVESYVVSGTPISSGDFVKYVTTTPSVGGAKWFGSPDLLYFPSVAALTDTLAIVMYANDNYARRLEMQTLSISDTTITVGTKTQVDAAAVNATRILRISDTQAIILYTNSRGLCARVLEFNATSFVNAGLEYILDSQATSTQSVSISSVNATNFIIGYCSSVGGYNVKSVVISVSGTVITAGNIMQIAAVNGSSADIDILSPTRAIMIYTDNSNNGYATACLIDFSGTNISSVTTPVVVQSGASIGQFDMAVISPTRVVVVAQTGYGMAFEITISGTTLTGGTFLNFSNSLSAQDMKCMKLSSTKILVIYKGSASNYYGTYQIISITDAGLVAGTPTVFISQITYNLSISRMSNDRVLTAWYNGSTYGYTSILKSFLTLAKARTGGDMNGIAKTSGSAGQTVEIYTI